METGFNRPDKIKKQEPMDKPKEGKNSPWDYRCPQYDERSSCYVKAGTDYGVGYKVPVGHEGDPAKTVSALPYGRVNTMKVNERI